MNPAINVPGVDDALIPVSRKLLVGHVVIHTEHTRAFIVFQP